MIWECPECGKICTSGNAKRNHNCKTFHKSTLKTQRRATYGHKNVTLKKYTKYLEDTDVLD